MFGSPMEYLRGFAAAEQLAATKTRRERRILERTRKAALRSGNPARRDAARRSDS